MNYKCSIIHSMKTDQQFRDSLAETLGLVLPDTISEEAIIEALTRSIARLLEINPDRLFSLLYRLDISEEKIKEAMVAEEGMVKKIAVLVYERQVEKMYSRQRYKSDPPGEDLAW